MSNPLFDEQKNAYAGQYLRTFEHARYTPRDYNPVGEQRIIVPQGAEEFADVSFWQEKIDWDKYIQNARMAIPRISQGNWRDVQWDRNYSEGKRVGCLLGGYHFCDDRYHPDEQTATILSAMAGKELELEVFLDWESVYGGPYSGLTNILKIHRNLVNAGIKCHDVGIYSGYYFVLEHSNAVDNAADFQYIRDENIPFWIAWYANPEVVRIPPPWTTWVHWQLGTPVRDWGQATAEIDIDKPNGTPEQVTAKYGGGTTPPDNGGDMPTTGSIKGTAKSGTITNIKPMAGGGAIATLTPGQYVYGELSALETDIINFDHYYTADGTLVDLGVLCKVSVGNLIVTAEQEPGTEPPPSGTLPVIHYSRTETFRADGYPDKTVTTEFDWTPNA